MSVYMLLVKASVIVTRGDDVPVPVRGNYDDCDTMGAAALLRHQQEFGGLDVPSHGGMGVSHYSDPVQLCHGTVIQPHALVL